MSLDLKKYKEIGVLGEGDNTQVFKVFNEEENKYYALKKILIVNPEDFIKIKNEVEIFSQFNSKKIVKYYGSTKIDNNFYILMEYVEGQSLEEFIKDYKDKAQYLDEVIIYKIIAQICSAVELIHSKDIVHRDLKPLNIIINKNNEIKIIDFGISKKIEKNINFKITKNQAGSHRYYAPEIEEDGKFNKKSDIYSFGLIMYNLFTLSHYNSKNCSIEISNFYCPEWQELMKNMLLQAYDKRFDIEEVIDFINKNLLKEKIFIKDFNTNYGLQIADINVEKISIKYIYIQHQAITLLSSIAFSQLKELSLVGNGITNINALKNINTDKLEILNLFSNEISDIKVFNEVKLNKLKILNLGQNRISDINLLVFTKFNELTELNLSRNEISDINILENVKFNKLEILDLSYNNISNTYFLEKMSFQGLKKLDLSYNKIKDNNILREQTNIPIYINMEFNSKDTPQSDSFKILEFLFEMIEKIDNIFQFEDILDLINIAAIKKKTYGRGKGYFFLLKKVFETITKKQINSLKDEELKEAIKISVKFFKILNANDTNVTNDDEDDKYGTKDFLDKIVSILDKNIIFLIYKEFIVKTDKDGEKNDSMKVYFYKQLSINFNDIDINNVIKEIGTLLKEAQNKILDDLVKICKFTNKEFYSNESNQKILLLYNLFEKGIIKIENINDKNDLISIKNTLDDIKIDLAGEICKQTLENFLNTGEEKVLKKLELIKLISPPYNPDKIYAKLIEKNKEINSDLENLSKIKNTLLLFQANKYSKDIESLTKTIKELNEISLKSYNDKMKEQISSNLKRLRARCSWIDKVKDFILFKIIYDESSGINGEVRFNKATDKLKQMRSLFDSNKNFEEIYEENKIIFDKIKELINDDTSKADSYIHQIIDYFMITDEECINDLTILIESKIYETNIRYLIFFFENFNPKDEKWKKILPKEYENLSELSLSEMKKILYRLTENGIYDYHNNTDNYFAIFKLLYKRKDEINYLLSKINKDIQYLYDKIELKKGKLTKNDINDFKECIELFKYFKSLKNNFEIYKYIKTKFPVETIRCLKSYIKNYPQIIEIDIFNDIIKDSLENIELIANKVNKNIIEAKIGQLYRQIKNYKGESCALTLSEIIYMSNARKYGRKLENIVDIYNKIKTKYLTNGKTEQELEDIMADLLPDYGLGFEEVVDEELLKDYIKRGIKCYVSFYLNQQEWQNFTRYFKNYYKNEFKLLTKEIIEKRISGIKNPDKIQRYEVVLTDIDRDGNYILVNCWEKNWGIPGIFKSKKECLKQGQFFAVYYYIDLLKNQELKSWDELKKIIGKKLIGMKSIICPKCKKEIEIEKYNLIDMNNLNNFKCPFSSCKNTFVIPNDNNTFEFIVEQLMYNKKCLILDFDKQLNHKIQIK